MLDDKKVMELAAQVREMPQAAFEAVKTFVGDTCKDATDISTDPKTATDERLHFCGQSRALTDLMADLTALRYGTYVLSNGKTIEKQLDEEEPDDEK